MHKSYLFQINLVLIVMYSCNIISKEKSQFEIDYLSEWLPEQLSDDELEKIVDQVLSEMGDVDISQMGKVIGAVMSKGDGIDGGAVSKIVKGKLS